MYKKFKRLIKAIIPRRFLFKYEFVFRFLIYLFYKGRKFKCNICKKTFRKFILSENEDKLCPNCGSLPRNRRLWELLNTEFLKDKIKILDFSPSRCLYRVLKNNPSFFYTSTDISGNFLADKNYNIANIDSQEGTFDLIICYHILEHIENDKQAINELYRTLKNGGVCIIQTPFKEGEIYEDNMIQNPLDRLKHFGQEDHVRIYSLTGLQKRLSDCDFSVEIREYNDVKDNRYGYKEKEFVFICRK